MKTKTLDNLSFCDSLARQNVWLYPDNQAKYKEKLKSLNNHYGLSTVLLSIPIFNIYIYTYNFSFNNHYVKFKLSTAFCQNKIFFNKLTKIYLQTTLIIILNYSFN